VNMRNMSIYRVCPLLSSFFKLISCYQEYCVNQANAAKILHSLRNSNSELATHLQVRITVYNISNKLSMHEQRLREDPTVRNLDLSSYLLVPSKHFYRYVWMSNELLLVQRITRYPLLIKQV
jgi:actin cytoskeleton-regulatory complex protein PAN1